MRTALYQRRRMPRFRISGRVDGAANVSPPAGGVPPVDDESSDDELSDGESTDDEFSDEELSDDEDSLPPGSTPPSTSSGLGTTTTSISSQSTIVAAPTTTLATGTSKPAQEPATTSTASPSTASSTLTSSQTIPLMSTNTLLSSVSTISSSTPAASTSPTPVLDPGDLTTSTSVIPQSTDSAQLSPSTDLSSQPANFINPTDESQGSTSNHSQRAGQIAGGVVGGIAFIGLVLLAIWAWRRRRNRDNYLSRMSTMPPDDTPYPDPQPRGPGNYRSPSSIMNQLMTAAYAAEDGRSYRDSNGIFDNYANEKQAFTVHENESTERLTVPPTAQLRPPSIAARTETTNRTESTWKTWGVLAGSSRLPAPRNWWVDRYFRT